jgi:ketosteroid isomerase-like protein
MGDFSKDEFKAIVENFGSALKGPMKMIIDGVTAEQDRVAVEAHAVAELANGKSYRNTYHFLFVFEKGKIKRAKEYNDSKHAAETLGALLPLR